jgi:hypothetical protein
MQVGGPTTMNSTAERHTTLTRQRLARARTCEHARGHARLRARALTLNYGTTETTNDKTFRERQISICLNSTPKEQDVNTRPRARTRVTKDEGGDVAASRAR